MNERAELIAYIRGELLGPSRPMQECSVIEFNGKQFNDSQPKRRGAIGWRPLPDGPLEEVLYYDRESPHRKYGVGLLHPCESLDHLPPPPDELAMAATEIDTFESVSEEADQVISSEEESTDEQGDLLQADDEQGNDEFEVTSPDLRRPSTIGVTFCARLQGHGRLLIRLPQERRFSWQSSTDEPFKVNGRYEACTRHWVTESGDAKESPVWRRHAAVAADTVIEIPQHDLVAQMSLSRPVALPVGSPLSLLVEVFPRRAPDQADVWLITVVLRNRTRAPRNEHEAKLYQAYFEVGIEGGQFERYPESHRSLGELDAEEQTLVLLYRESATWGIGHGCAAGWDCDPGRVPSLVYADAMPAVELPSMTPDIVDELGQPLQLSMRQLAALPDDGEGPVWHGIRRLSGSYRKWIAQRRTELAELPHELISIAERHLDDCEACLERIQDGISLLESNHDVRSAFRLANVAMLLQQIATKQLTRRPLTWDASSRRVRPADRSVSPWDIYVQQTEGDTIGKWRAFQIAFLLMSLRGAADPSSDDREIVDLIWFPTGGGKTEAYLGVMALYMFHERLRSEEAPDAPRRDGTNVLMRYTLRMLTTQQFQRAASLICAMEFIRRTPESLDTGALGGGRFSLGLWIGGSGSPNKVGEAKRELNAFGKGDIQGNPLVLTECPWCRAEIGRYDGTKPNTRPTLSNAEWNSMRVRGITTVTEQGPLLHCTDSSCSFGSEAWEQWLPIEVIDERIYRNPPSLVIATADKFAMLAYRPQAGALFGRQIRNGATVHAYMPPGLIIQDELHLISGPLGTMFAAYEAIIERLCSRREGGAWLKPKLIASTATIRGADYQVMALYAREKTRLFPAPGVAMSDSFFGAYAYGETDGKRLRDGRLYLGVCASDYGSSLTAQVRAFAAVLAKPFAFENDRRDAWWTLLVFYNSIRELGGAKTLFDSDIRSRLKFMFNREGYSPQVRRQLRIVEELTGRLSQAEIVDMMDRLAIPYAEADGNVIDACLASNIIEVGVDIDRLSVMGVVGQPKSTAQYIQVTGRVGRRWWERPGLILMIYNPFKSRDRSHFEQFHSYHRRLYERVEPASATPFAISAIQRTLPGALIAWARQQSDADVSDCRAYEDAIDAGLELMVERCNAVQDPQDIERSINELSRVRRELDEKWRQNPQEWEEFPPSVNGEYLMLWPGQFATLRQRKHGVTVPSSMRQVDGSGELTITEGYNLDDSASAE